MDICDPGALGDFVTVDGKNSVSSLDAPYYLEKASYFFGNDLAPFKFIRTLNEVPLLLGLAHFGSYECVHHYWL